MLIDLFNKYISSVVENSLLSSADFPTQEKDASQIASNNSAFLWDGSSRHWATNGGCMTEELTIEGLCTAVLNTKLYIYIYVVFILLNKPDSQ